MSLNNEEYKAIKLISKGSAIGCSQEILDALTKKGLIDLDCKTVQYAVTDKGNEEIRRAELPVPF